MKIEPFELERIQSLWEHVVEFNLSESGVHPLTLGELVGEEHDSLQRLIDRELGYSQTNGTVALRERIATLYPGATADSVLVCNGTSEANFVTIWGLIEPGDELVLMLPNYMQIWGLVRGFEGRVKPFHLRFENQWAPDLDELRRAVTEKTKAIAVCNPNNPTGYILRESEMETIVEIASRAGAWLIADEVYLGAERQVERTKSFWAFRDRYDRIIINNGLSKAYGLPGLRIGWSISTAEQAGRLWSYRDYTTIAPGNLSDQIAQIALEPATREWIFDRTRKILQHNFAILSDWLKDQNGFYQMVEPKAGAIAMLRGNFNQGSLEFVDRLRREKSVLLVPGEHFGLPGFLRFGYGCDVRYLEEGLRRIGQMNRQD